MTSAFAVVNGAWEPRARTGNAVGVFIGHQGSRPPGGCVLPTSLELGLRSQTAACRIRLQEHARSIETPRVAISGHSNHDYVLSRLALVTSVKSSPTPSFREKGGVPEAANAPKTLEG